MLHMFFGLMALIFALPDGGGDGDGEGGEGGEGEGASGDEGELGDAGKKAIQAERKSKRDAEKRAKTAEARVAQLEADAKKAEDADATENEKAIAAAVKQATKDATDTTADTYKSRILATEVLAAATGKLSTPGDAAMLLDLSAFDVDATSEELRDSLDSAIDELLADKPYLKAGKVQGSADGGAKPKSANDDDVTPAERLRRAYSTPTT